MRLRLSSIIAFAWLLAVPLLSAETAPTLQQQYLDLYIKLHDAEILEKNGDFPGALKGFQACYDGLSAIHHSDPDWETALVGHRMDDCRVAIQEMQKKVPAQSQSPDVAPPPQTATPPPNLAFKTDSPAPKQKNAYPWKTGIITSMFYLGDKAAKNAWNIKISQGSDSPDDRNGYASGTHASSFNPFYVALPFNDLAYPDKAKQYLPAGWQRPDKDGKPVSACKDRWVEIKTEDGSGHICYAQWEDVGPGSPDDAKYGDDAEYVFGKAKPRNQHAGIDVSPAVAQYLGSNDEYKPLQTSWRFVDAENVPPGAWLKYDEQAVIYTAMHQVKDSDAPSAPDLKK